MQPIPLVRNVFLAPSIAFLADEGISVDRYLRRARLSAPTAETMQSLIPLRQLCDLLSLVAHEQDLNDLGFRIAGQLGIESLGTFGRIITRAFTLHESVLLSRELISAFNSGQQIWLEHHGDQVRYCQKLVGSLPPSRTKEVQHLGLAIALAVVGVGRGNDWRPTQIELATNPIDLGDYVPELGDIPISFNQSHTSVWFDRTWLSKPLPRVESFHCPSAYEAERASFLETGPCQEPIDQLEQAIESAFGHPELGLQMTAAIIGMSPRSLQRHLAEEGQSFSRLLQSVRFRTAQQLLRDPAMPLTEISRRLSYADLANFIRAFKRWTGLGPNEFRKLHYENQHD